MKMNGESVSRHISETIKSGDEEFIIEINSDYSDGDNDSEVDTPVVEPPVDQYDEIDSLQQSSDEIDYSSISKQLTSPQHVIGTKIHSPLKIGRDEEGKVNYIGLAQDPSTSQLEEDLPPGLENIKIVNVCTLADDHQEDKERLFDADSQVYKATECFEDTQDTQDTIPTTVQNMIIVDEQPSNSTLMVKLVCKFCQKLFPTHEALYIHAQQHKHCEENENEPLVGKHFSQLPSNENIASSKSDGTKISRKVKKASPPKKMKVKRRSQGSIVEENKCEKCGKIFIKDYQYKMHISMCKGKITQMATCFECNKMIPAHEEYEHALKYHDVVCRICGVNQMQESKLKNHMRFMHNISNYGKDTDDIPQIHVVEQVYYKSCIQCGQVCASFDEYRLHRKGHAKMEIKPKPEKEEEKVEITEKKIPFKKKKDRECEPVKCEKCDKEFPSSYHLRSHLKRCSGQAVKMILCDVCEQLLPKDEVKEHVKAHECLCSDCGKVCMGERHLLRHKPFCSAKQEKTCNKGKQKDSFKVVTQGVKIRRKKELRALRLANNVNRKLTPKQEQLKQEVESLKKCVFKDTHAASEFEENENDKIQDPSNERLSMNTEETKAVSLQHHKLVSKNVEEKVAYAVRSRTRQEREDRTRDSSTTKVCPQGKKSVRTENLIKDFVEKGESMKMECGGIKQDTCDQYPDQRNLILECRKRPRKGRTRKWKRRQKNVRQVDNVAVSSFSMNDICNKKDTNQILETEVRHTEESEGERLIPSSVIIIDPTSSLESFSSKTLQKKAYPVNDLQSNLETFHSEYSAQNEESTEDFIRKHSVMINLNMSHVPVSDWLLQTTDSNNINKTWICRHCGKQLSSVDEGLTHMIKSHPTNKTTKEIRKEISHLKRNQNRPFVNDCFFDSSNASY